MRKITRSLPILRYVWTSPSVPLFLPTASRWGKGELPLLTLLHKKAPCAEQGALSPGIINMNCVYIYFNSVIERVMERLDVCSR